MKNQALFGLCLLGIAMVNPAHAVLLSDVTVDIDTYVEASSAMIDYDSSSEQIGSLFAPIDSMNNVSRGIGSEIWLFARVDISGHAILDSSPDISVYDVNFDQMLGGNLLDTAFDASDSFALLFQTTGGSAASEFGGYFVATFTSSLRNTYASPSDIVFPEMGSLRINAAALNNVSEPATLSLLAIALLGGPLIRRRKRSL
ncbi:PEP-CTERM sorting domain-containing protein [Thiocystis violascens]|uniref:PEP-CTERM putative exosortase interaction domain-containing protein n=1 Tax=Thiocystis violascens (strain ATCC 17096 / DSM 198 / 6111) TaxID=765911 RepID=I3YF62_THIV6|nr:PEP-CTERM sorting domain-containing protein [Thiocystis violascens]AFL75630.1 PEP-CTERM putative exosortase interaction domain-containing protein [Thiocystis violascens DSM 198]